MSLQTSAPEPKTLQVVLDAMDDKVRANWSMPEQNRHWDSYSVSASDLSQRAHEIHQCLQELEDINWEDSAEAILIPILRRLADAGSGLYQSLLTGHPNDPQSRRSAQNFRGWFEREVIPSAFGTWRIQVVHKSYEAPIVPWGLTFTPLSEDRSIDKLTASYEDLGNFWSISYLLACRGILSNQSHNLDQKRDTASIVVTVELDNRSFANYHREVQSNINFDILREHLSNSPDSIEELSSHYRSFDIFWYVCLDAESGNYLLQGEEIGNEEIARLEEQIDRDKVVVMLLDGDAVIRGDRGGRWIDAMLKVGRSGLIAAETDIRNPSLRHFGWEFLKFILHRKEPLITAISEARREFWPKSLLYGVYCDPLHVYFDPPPEEDIDLVDRFLKMTRDMQFAGKN